MRDKRPVDELSIEELERVLAIRRREERQRQLERMKRSGRVVGNGQKPASPPVEPVITVDLSAGPALPAETVDLPASAVTRQASEVVPRFEDDPGDVLPKAPNQDRAWKTFVNRALLVVEVAAVAGLVFMGVSLLGAIGKLEQETASAQQAAQEIRQTGIPTIAPTPQLRLEQIVLPGGHKPPSEGLQFNYDEIPTHLLSAVQSQIMAPVLSRPPQTDQTALSVIIPKINIEAPIIQGTDWEALKQGVGQLVNGIDPGDESGNVVLAAHNDIYGEIFRHLDQLEAGDQFQIQTATRIYTYEIKGWQIVEPTDVHVMDNTNQPTATLISCYPFQVNNKRIVVYAERVGV